MNKRMFYLALGTLVMIGLATVVQAYPLDGYAETGIRRLEFYRLAEMGEIRGRKLPEGAQLPTSAVDLARPELPLNAAGFVDLPQADALLSRRIAELLAAEDQPRYGIAVLDYSDPENPVYAEHNGDYLSNVGSVGKLLVGVAVFQELAEAYPDDIDTRRKILRETMITADEYANYDHHEVPLFDVDARELDYRKLRVGDTGNLYEWLDWMFSASSNSAASMVMQQATLLKHFGALYPRGDEAHAAWLEQTGHHDEGAVTVAALTDGLTAHGFDTARIRQGSYFTRGGKRAAAGVTSYATPRELVRLLGMIEAGCLIDDWSSRELKRLMYMTQRRIRYASHPALHDSAVYFKSGSLYSCKEEPGFVCEKYKGNRKNILGSVAIVESPADEPRLRYAVAVVSNVLYKNSAVAHQTLAMRIHRLLERRHAPATQ